MSASETTHETALANIDKARLLLDKARTLDSIIDVRDKAAAIEAYARAKGADQAQMVALELKLRAERKAGQFLWDIPRQQGSRTDLTLSQDETKLSEVRTEYGRNNVDRWQKIASIPDQKFEEYISRASEKSQTALLWVAKEVELEMGITELKDRIPSETPQGQYDIIVIDPPWPYGTPYDAYGRRVAAPYPELPIEEIKAIKLPAAEDCVLWLWTTNAFLRVSFDIMEQWGFQYRILLTWMKNKMGTGSWLRGQTEHCLLGTKGNPIWKLNNQTTALIADKTGHSTKPKEFYNMVDALCVGKKLDYFGRGKHEGWEIFGTD